MKGVKTMTILKELINYLRSNTTPIEKILFVFVIWIAVSAITVALILYVSYKFGNDDTPENTDSTVKEIEPSKNNTPNDNLTSCEAENNNKKEEEEEEERKIITIITTRTTRRSKK